MKRTRKLIGRKKRKAKIKQIVIGNKKRGQKKKIRRKKEREHKDRE